MTEYRVASIIQVFSFMTLIGPFLCFKIVIVPVMVIYGCTFWGVYATAPESDILLFEAGFKFFSYSLTILAVAYVY